VSIETHEVFGSNKDVSFLGPSKNMRFQEGKGPFENMRFFGPAKYMRFQEGKMGHWGCGGKASDRVSK
jgi:hypothetical protein